MLVYLWAHEDAIINWCYSFVQHRFMFVCIVRFLLLYLFEFPFGELFLLGKTFGRLTKWMEWNEIICAWCYSSQINGIYQKTQNTKIFYLDCLANTQHVVYKRSRTTPATAAISRRCRSSNVQFHFILLAIADLRDWCEINFMILILCDLNAPLFSHHRWNWSRWV